MTLRRREAFGMHTQSKRSPALVRAHLEQVLQAGAVWMPPLASTQVKAHLQIKLW